MTPPDYMPDWAYKNGLLLESTDGGRSFREVPGGLFASRATAGPCLDGG